MRLPAFGNCVPGVAVFCLLLRVCGDCFAQSFFLLTLSFNERLVLQALKLAAIDFETVLNAVQLVLSLFDLLFAARHVALQNGLASFKIANDERNAHVAQLFKVCDSVQARSRTWMTCYENKLALFRALRREFQMVVRMHGLALFIDAHQRHVYVVTREVEIIGIAAKERSLKFRHEDQTHIRIFLVAIKIVAPALIERDDIRAQTSLLS